MNNLGERVLITKGLFKGKKGRITKINKKHFPTIYEIAIEDSRVRLVVVIYDKEFTLIE